jgi:alginate O-acetyltransferase complex protein AlgI
VNTVESSLPEGGERLVIGLFKKFVLADSLALVALNSSNAGQITSTGWMWLALILYSLQIYFDFSGYTDIAIGLGLFLGIRLPENFDHPYLKGI